MAKSILVIEDDILAILGIRLGDEGYETILFKAEQRLSTSSYYTPVLSSLR